MDFLTDQERAQIKELQKMGILVPFKKGEMQGLTQNGGLGVFCGDGDTDALEYHKETIHIRRHSVTVFGGPIAFAISFRGYDTGLAEGLIRNALVGMSAKKTKSVFLYPHWPCQMGKVYGYTMIDVINLMLEVVHVFQKYSKNIHLFFHTVRKTAHGHVKQNTYKLVLPTDGEPIRLPT